MKPRVLIIDLDDTLYDYVPAERVAREATLATVSHDLGITAADAQRFWDAARDRVKARLGERGSAHSRLLYLTELAHLAKKPRSVHRARAWEAQFWSEFLRVAELRTGAARVLDGFRAGGGSIAIVTDLTLDIQLRKMETFDLFRRVDVLVVSEEVASDKPARDALALAFERLADRLGHEVPPAECLFAGDSDKRDGGVARAFGVPFFHVASSEPGAPGKTLDDLADFLGLP